MTTKNKCYEIFGTKSENSNKRLLPYIKSWLEDKLRIRILEDMEKTKNED